MQHSLIWDPLAESLIHGLLGPTTPIVKHSPHPLTLVGRQRSVTRWTSSRPARTFR
jgi:hypothetical protein